MLCEQFTLFSFFLLYCFTTGNQCGAFTYENVAVGSLGSISFSSCHKWSHGRIILDGNFVFFSLFFSFLWGNLLGEQIRLRSMVFSVLGRYTYIFRKSIHTAKRERLYLNWIKAFTIIASCFLLLSSQTLEEKATYQNSVQSIILQQICGFVGPFCNKD